MAGESQEITISRHQLIIAAITTCATLLVTSVSLYQILMQQEELKTVNLTIQNSTDLRHALEKPLEGVWHYNISYSKFHNDDENTPLSSGIAMFYWDASAKVYDSLMAYKVSEKWKPQEDEITGFYLGSSRVNDDGIPKEDFVINAEYKGRTSRREGDVAPISYQLKFNCSDMQMDPESRKAKSFVCGFGAEDTAGQLVFERAR